MAEVQLLGLFHEATPTANTIDQLRKLGVTDDHITVLSSMPYKADMLGRPRARTPVGKFALAGALFGLGTGVLLTVGTFLAYPMIVGGQPLVPMPPTLIILFETTMLGTMWATFLGLLLGNRLPLFRPLVYDPRITEGHIGVALQVDEALAPRAEQVLKANGAHHFKRMAVAPRHDRGFRVFWAAVVALLVLISAAALLPAYDIVRIPIPTNMAEQDVVAYDQGPRIEPPAGAVPVQGVALVGGQVASTPAPSSTQSLQYGQVLYDQHCALCHGQDGKGAGPLAHYFQPGRVSLVGGTASTLSDAQIFAIITQGRGQMPPLAEDLTQAERWDVIDYIHTLRH